MKDTQFQDLLDKLVVAKAKYRDLLNEAESEYKRRWGYYPAEIDDDFWIDSFCQGCSPTTVVKVMLSALDHIPNN